MGTRRHSGSVSIVDEDAGFRSLIAGHLERSGFETREFASGEEAFEDACRERPSVVVLEVRLPGTCGYEICRELRDEFGHDLGIVLVSADRTEPRDRIAGLLLGADDYFAKPLAADELIARVRALAEKRRGASNRERFDGLTDRELEILGLLADGLGQAAIAKRLVISPKTVAGHIERILTKLGVHSRAEAVAVAYREELVPVLTKPASE